MAISEAKIRRSEDGADELDNRGYVRTAWSSGANRGCESFHLEAGSTLDRSAKETDDLMIKAETHADVDNEIDSAIHNCISGLRNPLIFSFSVQRPLSIAPFCLWPHRRRVDGCSSCSPHTA
jgi:hypothetical protein